MAAKRFRVFGLSTMLNADNPTEFASPGIDNPSELQTASATWGAAGFQWDQVFLVRVNSPSSPSADLWPEVIPTAGIGYFIWNIELIRFIVRTKGLNKPV